MSTGYCSKRREEYPFDDDVIKTIHDLATKEKQHLLLHKDTFLFGHDLETFINKDEIESIESDQASLNCANSHHSSALEIVLNTNDTKDNVVTNDQENNNDSSSASSFCRFVNCIYTEI